MNDFQAESDLAQAVATKFDQYFADDAEAERPTIQTIHILDDAHWLQVDWNKCRYCDEYGLTQHFGRPVKIKQDGSGRDYIRISR